MAFSAAVIAETQAQANAVTESLTSLGNNVVRTVVGELDAALIRQCGETAEWVLLRASNGSGAAKALLPGKKPPEWLGRSTVVVVADECSPGTVARLQDAGVTVLTPNLLLLETASRVGQVYSRLHKRITELQRTSEEFETEYRNLKLVTQAKSILMAKHQCDENTAHKTLQRLAMQEGKKLAEVAHTIVVVEAGTKAALRQ